MKLKEREITVMGYIVKNSIAHKLFKLVSIAMAIDGLMFYGIGNNNFIDAFDNLISKLNTIKSNLGSPILAAEMGNDNREIIVKEHYLNDSIAYKLFKLVATTMTLDGFAFYSICNDDSIINDFDNLIAKFVDLI